MSVSDWITAGIAMGGLVVAIISLIKSSRTGAAQLRLAKFQIAEHEAAAAARTEALAQEEFGKLYHEALNEYGNNPPTGQPGPLDDEGGVKIREFFEKLEKMSPAEKLEFLRSGREIKS